MRTIIAIFLLCGSLTWASPSPSVRKPTPIRAVNATGRIVNGELASKGQFPWQAAIIFNTPEGQFFCGGSLISDEWIVTAGHCAYGVDTFTIYLGTMTLDPDEDALVVTSSTAVVHPQYDPEYLSNDIALIKLDQTVQHTEYIQPIRLAATTLADRVTVFVSGWGKSNDAQVTVGNDLQYINLYTMNSIECGNYFGPIGSEVVCCEHFGTAPTRSPCGGDTGGPLTSSPFLHPSLVGIVSFFNPEGCETNWPSGYTRIHYFRVWIREVTGV